MPGPSHDPFFRWRAQEPTRIEGLSDAVFGFAITLLVISLEVPRTFEELSQKITLPAFLAFAASFVLLLMVWYRQYLWFRRYALQDTPSVLLNAALLFVVIFYVYPLKFLATVLTIIVGLTPVRTADGLQVITNEQVPRLMLIYGAGFVAVYVVFLALHAHAWKMRAALALSPGEEVETRFAIIEDGIMITIGSLSILLALLGQGALAGMSYMLIGPAQFTQGSLRGRAQRRLVAPAAKETPA